MSKSTINNNATVEVRKMNNIVEVKLNNHIYYDKSPERERIDKNHYIDTDTGEVCKYDSSDIKGFNGKDKPLKVKKESEDKSKDRTDKTSKLQCQQSLRKTAKLYKEMIITNFKSPESTMYITFKYNNKIDDINRVGLDMTNLIKRIRKYYQTTDNKMKYIFCMEYDHNGSIHVHCLLYWDKEYPTQLVVDLPSLWKKGETHIKQIKGNEDILYIAAYLTGSLSGKEKSASRHDISTDGENKMEIKHARVSYYKPYERFFRASIKMEKTQKETMTYEEAKEKYKLNNAFSSNTYHKDIKHIGTIINQTYEYYLK